LAAAAALRHDPSMLACSLHLALSAALATQAPDDLTLTPATAQRFADLALACVHREYPNKLAHVLASDADAKPPRLLTPAFYGCYDWHSAVHGHWLLARLARTFPQAPFAAAARDALAQSLTAEHVAAEVAYLQTPGRATFERPYGLAWLLQLDAELRQWPDPAAQQQAQHLRPLARVARARFAAWLPKLSRPVRTGEHSQTAFALGLVLDWARIADDGELRALALERAREFYLGDQAWNLQFEPGGEDFLSPSLAEADLMRRVLPPDEFAPWLTRFLPQLGAATALVPALVTDQADGKLAHLDGLNLSRAWMLEGIAHGLPPDDARRAGLLAMAAAHRRAGLAAVSGTHYEGGHWLGSFAVYLTTQRGLN
jgi:hypothetical protein